MADEAPKITIKENGPLIVTGLTEFTTSDGQAIDCKPMMALCRCGLSKKKPFCDGSHNAAGWDGSLE